MHIANSTLVQATVKTQPQIPIVNVSWLQACQQANAKAGTPNCSHHVFAVNTYGMRHLLYKCSNGCALLQVEFTGHRLKPFAGLEICISGYVQRKVLLAKLINQLGGRYNPELNKATGNVLVCERTTGPKYL